MDILLLNNHLAEFGLELVCDLCERDARQTGRLLPTVSASPLKPKESRSRPRKVRKASSQVWPISTRAKKRPSVTRLHSKVSNGSDAPSRNNCCMIQNPNQQSTPQLTDPKTLPPNSPFNLNICPNVQNQARLNIRQLLDENMSTPHKIADVYLLGSHKNANVLDSEFRPQLFSTVDNRLESVNEDSMRDFSFDIPHKETAENHFAFRNPPSPFQSPFVPGRAFIVGGTPQRGINFDRVPKSLDFLANPFLTDF